eukprot:1732837-Pleurochrysis_carterae.AAC.1
MRPDQCYFSRHRNGERSLTPSDLEAQDAAELAKAERDAETSPDTSDSEYDPNRPYSLWENYYLDDDDGTFDQERVEARLDAENAEYAERRNYRAAVKRALAHGDPDELVDLRRSLSDNLIRAQHVAARSSSPSECEDDIRRYAKFMARLDARERELGPPSSYSVLADHQSPVRTPGFRGYYAGCRYVPAE